MKTIDQLEKQLEKENQLIEKHKKNAAKRESYHKSS